FDQPQPPSTAKTELWFAQQWNYRYTYEYGSPEYSVKHPDQTGHDPVEIRAVHRLQGGKQLFIEIPQLQPVNQFHLYYRGAPDSERLEIFATIHNLAPPFTRFPGYQPVAKTNTPTNNFDTFDAANMIQACTACHHPTIKVVGPPFSEIRERYAGNPQGIVQWAIFPENKTPEMPPMPSFYFMGRDNLMDIAKRILAGDVPHPTTTAPPESPQ
ncbi:MAG: c-type cytochrome, partial [Planctomycetota bacterium]